jgi:tungstate transport system substrate-binding protein
MEPSTMAVPVLARAMLIAALLAAPAVAVAQARSILVQSTTSTANSGLYDHLLPIFEETAGIRVDVVAVGTGQAIRNARACDGDVLLVHAREAEEAFVADGGGIARHDLMYNDFVLVGPGSDPADIAGLDDAGAAMAQIAESESLFASRGDDSGTHQREMALWEDAGVDPIPSSGAWYRETGSGMGATLNAAVGMNAYTLTDRASWITFANKGGFDILVEGDEDLFNQYGVILVSPEACPNVDAAAGQAFVDWLLSDAGQGAIAAFEVDGQQLFTPNAAR